MALNNLHCEYRTVDICLNSVAWSRLCRCYYVANEYVKRIGLVVEMPSNVSAFNDLHCKYSTVLIRPVVAQICSLPVEKGRCRASMRRFFFNSTSRQCEEFRFGGCEGNANRFDTEKDCNDFCGCKLRLELSVPCQHRIPMFKRLLYLCFE